MSTKQSFMRPLSGARVSGAKLGAGTALLLDIDKEGRSGGFMIECPWRFETGGRVAFGWDDDRVKLTDRVRELSGLEITSVDVAEGLLDASISFGGESTIRVFVTGNADGGYGWALFSLDGLTVEADAGLPLTLAHPDGHKEVLA